MKREQSEAQEIDPKGRNFGALGDQKGRYSELQDIKKEELELECSSLPWIDGVGEEYSEIG